MVKAPNLRLVLHGSVIMVVALVCGLASVVEVSSGTIRMWQAAHSALLVMAVWMFAQAAILRILVLKDIETSALSWALILTGYSLAFAATVQAVTGVRALGPSTSVINMSVFVANLIVVLGSVLTASLTFIGARNAMARGQHHDAVPRAFEEAR
jgi:hypothetical protein